MYSRLPFHYDGTYECIVAFALYVLVFVCSDWLAPLQWQSTGHPGSGDPGLLLDLLYPGNHDDSALLLLQEGCGMYISVCATLVCQSESL